MFIKLLAIFATLACISSSINASPRLLSNPEYRGGYYNYDSQPNIVQTRQSKGFGERIDDLVNELYPLVLEFVDVTKKHLPGILEEVPGMISTGDDNLDDLLGELIKMSMEFIATAVNDEGDYDQDFLRSWPQILDKGTSILKTGNAEIDEFIDEDLSKLVNDLIETAVKGDNEFEEVFLRFVDVLLRRLLGILEEVPGMVNTGNDNLDDLLGELIKMRVEFIKTAVNDEGDYDQDFQRSWPQILDKGTSLLKTGNADIDEFINEDLSKLVNHFIETAVNGENEFVEVLMRNLPDILEEVPGMVNTGDDNLDDLLGELTKMTMEFIATAVNEEDDYAQDFLRSLPMILARGTQTTLGYFEIQDANDEIARLVTKMGTDLAQKAINDQGDYQVILTSSLPQIIGIVTRLTAPAQNQYQYSAFP